MSQDPFRPIPLETLRRALRPLSLLASPVPIGLERIPRESVEVWQILARELPPYVRSSAMGEAIKALLRRMLTPESADKRTVSLSVRRTDGDAREHAFYYARVLEIPTPRWVVYDAFRYGIDIPEGARTIHQERAYTAPIWYTPGD